MIFVFFCWPYQLSPCCGAPCLCLAAPFEGGFWSHEALGMSIGNSDQHRFPTPTGGGGVGIVGMDSSCPLGSHENVGEFVGFFNRVKGKI